MLQNCPRCKKLFNKAYNVICDACVQEEHDTYDKVRDYLKENPGITIMELAKATDVSQKKILGYIKEGRLELLSGELTCEKCGLPIVTGRYCPECLQAMDRDLLDQIRKEKNKNKGMKMHTDKRDKDSSRRRGK